MASNRVRSVNWSSNSRIISPENVSVSKRKIFRPPKSVQEKVLCYSLCFLFIALMVFVAALCIIADRWKATLSKLTYTYLSEDVCDSEACQESAQKLLSNLDPTTDPCVDFYQYACGGWMEKNPIPEGDSVFMSYDIRTAEVRDTVVDLVTGIERNGARPRAIDALGKFFRACRDEDTRKRVGIEPLSRLLREFGGWPMVEGKDWKAEGYSWYERVARGNRDLYLDMIVDLSLIQSVFDSKEYVLFVRRGAYLFENSFLPLYKNPSSEVNVSVALLEGIVNMARLFGSKLDSETLMDEARKLVVFEFGLSMVGRVEDDFHAFQLTLGELDGNLSVPSEKSPDFSYKQFLNLHLRSEPLVNDQTSIYIQSLGHFIELPTYLEKTRSQLYILLDSGHVRNVHRERPVEKRLYKIEGLGIAGYVLDRLQNLHV